MADHICFFDLDGTLFSHASDSIPSSTLRSLSLLQKNGIPIVLATGRHFAELGQLEPSASIPFDAWIMLTGAYITDAGKRCIASAEIGEENMVVLTDWLNGHGYSYIVVEEEVNYMNSHSALARQVQDSIHTALFPVMDVSRIHSHPVYQLTVFAPWSVAEELMWLVPSVRASQWHSSAFDLSSIKAGKGDALRKVCDYFHVPVSGSFAFGDNNNDLDMLRAAGTGIAMGNGSPGAKQAADYVTDDIDADGIEHALLHFGLI